MDIKACSEKDVVVRFVNKEDYVPLDDAAEIFKILIGVVPARTFDEFERILNAYRHSKTPLHRNFVDDYVKQRKAEIEKEYSLI